MGVPVYSLLITWLFTALAYLRVSADGAVVFGYFVNLVTVRRLDLDVHHVLSHQIHQGIRSTRY